MVSEPQDPSIRERRQRLYEDSNDVVPAASASRRTVAEFLRETPPIPLSGAVKAMLGGAAVVVVLLMIAAIVRLAQGPAPKARTPGAGGPASSASARPTR